jgi:hypothetical protein
MARFVSFFWDEKFPTVHKSRQRVLCYLELVLYLFVYSLLGLAAGGMHCQTGRRGSADHPPVALSAIACPNAA